MKENANNHLDDLTKKIIKDTAIERPSFNFTNTVMANVNAIAENKATVYRPLISKTVWFFVIGLFLVVFLYVLFFANQTEGLGWFNKIDFSLPSNYLPDFKFSKTVTYSIVLFGLMLSIQIPILKHHLDKRFET
ncbi:hypothetical protein [Aestuariivivens marinum]|uniref:hypothetical protein n=1 Tax=Aestuariivivens marinum TaxID=2913555 RepID=UPI001F59562C|nr:hypothetical protein [Aestuariivivens marinum]